MVISESHPLRQLFRSLVERRFFGDAQLGDREIANYVTNLLVDFTQTSNLYKIRNARGKRLEDVGEMLLASNPLFEGRSFDYERAVRKHIGLRLDAFIDYVKAGKESYHIVSTFDLFEYAHEAPLFRKLANSFELCVFGLNLVKRDLEELQRSYYQGLRRILA